MKKVLVFGATGHLGAYTVDYLKDNLYLDEFELIAVGRKQTDFFKEQEIKYCQVDVTDKSTFERLPQEDVYAVVCFVGIMPAAMEGYNPYNYVDVNITGMLNILEYCRIKQVDRILFTQTEADLSGHWKENAVIKPDMPRKFNYKGNYSLYIITKCAAVDLIESYHSNYGLKRFIFRLPTIYHYRPDPYFYKDGNRKKLGYRQLMELAEEGKPIEIWGNPLLAKDIVYVKDFTQMIFKAILADVDGGTYNVGTGQAVTLEEQIKGIVEVFSPKEKKSEIIPRPDKPDSRSFVMDIENAKEDLGYNPKYNYIDYLKDFKKEMELNRFAKLWSK
ncbi:NAD-dependent epimerase/dehydratase family protein [Oceanobacillus jeddahense]|uniref:NAD-dependent epimerase/dehydratase family protein n=1 Tax=Oceanobacillus jeddahense TaxID=1462527 RepID=UPI000596089F|nr:NAD(P)-dependent oxidoreductase [Oceanobacillus jeddahense]